MTPLQKHLKDQAEQGNFSLDTLGEIIDDFITENECQMLITFPAGSSNPKIKDNMGLGPVGAFYFILKAITPTMNDLFSMFERAGGEIDREKVVDALLRLVRAELLEEKGAAE